MSEISDKEIHVLRHTLGLTRAPAPYRNHFVASEGHSDMPALLNLERHGLMSRMRTPAFVDQDSICFAATEAGKALAIRHTPKPEEDRR